MCCTVCGCVYANENIYAGIDKCKGKMRDFMVYSECAYAQPSQRQAQIHGHIHKLCPSKAFKSIQSVLRAMYLLAFAPKHKFTTQRFLYPSVKTKPNEQVYEIEKMESLCKNAMAEKGSCKVTLLKWDNDNMMIISIDFINKKSATMLQSVNNIHCERIRTLRW